MEIICKKIGELQVNTSKDLAEASLSPIIREEINKQTDSTQHKNGRNVVSPLMVACDKSQTACLQYFIDSFEKYGQNDKLPELEKLLGRPLDVSPDHENQAVHYGAMSCFAECAIYLAKILNVKKNTHSRSMMIGEKCNDSLFQSLITILSQKNSNGDTAFMMASFLGESQMLEMWIDQLFEFAKREKIPFKQCHRQIRNVISLKNKEGSCSLSLSYGHGHANVVDCLIKERQNWESTLPDSEGLLIVTHKDIEKAKVMVEKANAMLSLIVNGHNTEEQIKALKQKIHNTRRCLIMLQVSSAKLADKRSAELLASEGESEKKKIKNFKEKHISTKEKISHSPNLHIMSTNTNRPKDENLGVEKRSANIDLSIPFFDTLDDGSIVSSGKKKESIPQRKEKITRKNHIIQDMLRDRCLQSTCATNESTSEAIMDSLCLDASMLLLSPHGMAMELSPSQLDVVEKVLYNQMNAVIEAKKIRQRLMSHMKGDKKETIQ